MARRSSWAAALALLSWPAGALAQEGLHVEQGACVDAARLSFALSRTLSDGMLPAEVSVVVREVPDGAEFEITEGATWLGSRTVEAKDVPCAELIDALALSIAIVVDARALAPAPSALAQAPDGAPTTPPPSRSPLMVATPERELLEPKRAPLPALPQQPDAEARVALSLEGGVGVGVTPQLGGTSSLMADVGVGSRVEAGVRPELSLRGGMFVAYPSNDQIAASTISTSVIAPRLDVCAGVLGSTLRARACAAAIAGVLLAGEAGDYGRVALGGRVDGRWMLTPVFGLQAGVDVLVNVAPDYLALDGGLSELGPAALGASAGPTIEFF